ncbi:pali-domain-containing protein [Coniophora puteana RWD-64-598 SS2]|uniref:Pali-domain-containing protein n=1 Tax=Coniophora puteana (strain RWD-64-598) TaxID=741705 RepID=A0A5M3MV05_CONPW|nr:pali-domain-containing protein [Coniophora puteana RWD-64-598 SS2]EIW83012.1 pali-domain-containing protein [Coniophora puteana RWD-64-598 SS2]
MAASGALPGLFCCFAAMVLLIFVSVSSPKWERISFLDIGNLHFGVFGYTGSQAHIGWYFPIDTASQVTNDVNTDILHNLTYVLILYPIAAGLSGIAVLFGLCGASYHRVGTVFMTLVAALAMLATLIAWAISMALFGVARNRFQDAGISATWGNANWLALGALVALVFGFCASACGIFGHYRRTRF